MNVDELLKTEKGAQAVKAKLKALSDREKEQDSFKLLWEKACEAVSTFNLQKMQHSQEKENPDAQHKD